MEMTNSKLIISARYLSALISILEDRGCEVQKLLENTGLTKEQIGNGNKLLSAASLETFVANAMQASGFTASQLGLLIGFQSNLSSHGSPALAAMSSATLGEAIDMALKYFPLAVPYFKPFYYQDQDNMVLEFRESTKVSENLHQFLCGGVAISFLSMGSYLIDKEVIESLAAASLEFPFEGSAESKGYSDLRDTNVIFNANYTRVKFPKSLNDISLPLANAQARAEAIRESDQLLKMAQKNLGGEYLIFQVRQKLIERENGFPSIEQVAKDLCYSSRTLSRKLAFEGTSFRKILNEVKIEIAQSMLDESTLSVTQVAHHLGYTDAGNFTKAFKKMAGCNPSEYSRRRLQEAQEAKATAAIPTPEPEPCLAVV